MNPLKYIYTLLPSIADSVPVYTRNGGHPAHSTRLQIMMSIDVSSTDEDTMLK